MKVKFNAKSQATQTGGDKYKSYIRMLACTKVSINVEEWNKVPKRNQGEHLIGFLGIYYFSPICVQDIYNYLLRIIIYKYNLCVCCLVDYL